MDVYGPVTRSYVMSRIWGRDTKPEVTLRRLHWANSIRRYRLYVRLPGTSDIVFPKFRLAVFVNVCFWHGCPKCRIPIRTANRGYWATKIRRNKERDRRLRRELRLLGWIVLQIWEHEILSEPEDCLARVMTRLRVRPKC